MRKLISLLVMILLLLSAALAEVSPDLHHRDACNRQRSRRISPRRCMSFSRTTRAKTIWK